MNLERRKKSEQWVRGKAEEFVKLTSDLTFAEWCYQQGEKDGIRKFAEWLCENNAGIVDADNEEWKIKTIYRDIELVIEEYEKEQK